MIIDTINIRFLINNKIEKGIDKFNWDIKFNKKYSK